MSKLSADRERPTLEENADGVPHRRAEDATPRERRIGSSWLSRRSGRAILLLWLAWPALLAAVIALGAVLSTILNHGTQELPLAFTRSAERGLVLAAVVPPLCLTVLWYRMRGRRGRHRPARRDDLSPARLGSEARER